MQCDLFMKYFLHWTLFLGNLFTETNLRSIKGLFVVELCTSTKVLSTLAVVTRVNKGLVGSSYWRKSLLFFVGYFGNDQCFQLTRLRRCTFAPGLQQNVYYSTEIYPWVNDNENGQLKEHMQTFNTGTCEGLHAAAGRKSLCHHYIVPYYPSMKLVAFGYTVNSTAV